MPSAETIAGRDESPTLGPGIGTDLLLQLGPIFFSLVFNWCLLGTLIVQTYNYYLSFKQDSKWLKALVYIVFIFDLLQTALSTHSSFHTLVLFYGKPLVLQMPALTIIGTPLFGGLVGGCVQLFYAWRIWTLAKWPYKGIWLKVFIGIIVCTSVVATICAFTGSFIYLKIDTQAGIYATDLSKLFATWFSAGFAVDVLIAIAMFFIISNAKTNTSFKKTSDILSKVLIRTVATGAINAFVNCFGIVFLYAWPTFDLSEVAPYIGGKLYSNTLLMTLNARRTDSESLSNGPTSTSELSTAMSTDRTPGQLESLKFAPNLKSSKITSSNTGMTTNMTDNAMTTGSLDMSSSRDDINMQEFKPGDIEHAHGVGDFLEVA